MLLVNSTEKIHHQTDLCLMQKLSLVSYDPLFLVQNLYGRANPNLYLVYGRRKRATSQLPWRLSAVGERLILDTGLIFLEMRKEEKVVIVQRVLLSAVPMPVPNVFVSVEPESVMF